MKKLKKIDREELAEKLIDISPGKTIAIIAIAILNKQDEIIDAVNELLEGKKE